ncbi:MAG: hypothetical protein C4346_09365 [Chloroflexota bacterium]
MMADSGRAKGEEHQQRVGASASAISWLGKADAGSRTRWDGAGVAQHGRSLAGASDMAPRRW